MPSITAVELGADICALARTSVHGDEVRVAGVEMLDPAAFPGIEAFTKAVRQTRRAQKLPRRARAVVWGLPDGASRRDAAVRPLIEPLTGAGFKVERVVSPCNALAALARLRTPRPEAATCWLAINRGGVAIVAVRPGKQLYAHSFIWDSSIGLSGSQARLLQRYSLVSYLAPEVKRAMSAARQKGTPIEAIVTCGNFPDLRSLTMPLIEELDVEVETLDSLEGLAVKPEAVDRLSESAAAIRIACAGAVARPTRQRDEGFAAGLHRGRVATAAAVLVAAFTAGWFVYARLLAPAPTQVAGVMHAPAPPPRQQPVKPAGTRGSAPAPTPSKPAAVTRGSTPPPTVALPKSPPQAMPPVKSTPAPPPTLPKQTVATANTPAARPPVSAPPPIAKPPAAPVTKPAAPVTNPAAPVTKPAAPPQRAAATPATATSAPAQRVPPPPVRVTPTTPAPAQRMSPPPVRVTSATPAPVQRMPPPARVTSVERRPPPVAVVERRSPPVAAPSKSATPATPPSSSTTSPPASSVAPPSRSVSIPVVTAPRIPVAPPASQTTSTPQHAPAPPITAPQPAPPITASQPVPSRASSTPASSVQKPIAPGAPLNPPAVAADRSDAGNAARSKPLPPLLKDPLPRVTAILVANDRRYATIDEGHIITVGDVLGKRLVVAIDERVVVLREPSGVQIRVGLGGRLEGIDRPNR